MKNKEIVLILVLLVLFLSVERLVNLQTWGGEITVTNCDDLNGWVSSYCNLSISNAIFHEGFGSLKIVPTENVVGGGTWATYWPTKEYNVYSVLTFWAYPVGLSESSKFEIIVWSSSGEKAFLDCSSQLTQEKSWQEIEVNMLDSGFPADDIARFTIHWGFQNPPITATLYVDDIKAHAPSGLPLTVSLSPSSASIYSDEDITFTANVMGGAGGYIFQWLLDGQQTGQNLHTFTVSGANVAIGSHTVKCIVTDINGTHAEDEATLIVEEKPPPTEQTYTLTIKTTVGGTTDPAPGVYSKVEGETVEIKAIPDDKYSATHFKVNGEIVNQTTITIYMDKDYTVEAYFQPSTLPTNYIPPPVSEPPKEDYTREILILLIAVAGTLTVYFVIKRRKR